MPCIWDPGNEVASIQNICLSKRMLPSNQKIILIFQGLCTYKNPTISGCTWSYTGATPMLGLLREIVQIRKRQEALDIDTAELLTQVALPQKIQLHWACRGMAEFAFLDDALLDAHRSTLSFIEIWGCHYRLCKRNDHALVVLSPPRLYSGMQLQANT